MLATSHCSVSRSRDTWWASLQKFVMREQMVKELNLDNQARA
jgi:hypothetical protein